jgi:hypothetical protein
VLLMDKSLPHTTSLPLQPSYSRVCRCMCGAASRPLVWPTPAGDLVNLHCDGIVCPNPVVPDCYMNEDICAEDEWCQLEDQVGAAW